MEERCWTELLQGIVGSNTNIDSEMISTNYSAFTNTVDQPRDEVLAKNSTKQLFRHSSIPSRHSSKKELNSLFNNHGRLSIIFEHIQQLGWEFVKDFSEIFSELTINVGLYDITFIVHFEKEYPCCSPRIFSRFFSIQELPWDIDCDLQYLARIVYKNVKIYEEYFKAIQDIDTNSFVINAGFKDINMPNEKVNNYITPKLAIRTILISVALVGFVTCHITINHLRLTQPPECQFNGPHKDTTALARKYITNQDRWSMSRSVIQNLEDILNLVLPRPNDISIFDLSTSWTWNNFGQHDKTDAVCDICYTCGARNWVMCTNSKCSHFYHVDCIRAWLQSVVNSKLSFGILYGLCPYCGSNIEIPE